MPDRINIIDPHKLDSVVYGDYSYEYKQKISFKDPIIQYFFATGLINKHFKYLPPKNSSEETVQELLYNKKLSELAPDYFIQFSLNTDMSESKFYSDFAKEKLNLNLDKTYFDNLFDQVEPILFLLKEKFNRARPYQIAPLLGIVISNKIPIHHEYPSYPSGHALDACIAAYVLTKKAPDQKEKIYDFCDSIINSRLMANVHYLSDMIAGKNLAKDIIEHNLLKNI